MLNLIIDIGNTRTKAALFKGRALLEKVIWEKPEVAILKKWIYNQNVQNAILSSTAKVPADFEKYLSANYRYIHLDAETHLPITILYETPKTLGRDRIAAAVGADCLYPDEYVLVIDAGTCITLDMVTDKGEYLGGNISPGVEMRLKAMHHFTAKLPLVERSEVRGQRSDRTEAIPNTQYRNTAIPNFIGSSTETAIRNGAELGALLEVTSFMEKCRRRFKPLRVIFTGGDADFFVKNIKTKIFANQNLVLLGLNKTLEYNVEKLEQRKEK